MCIEYIINYGCCPRIEVLKPESSKSEETKINLIKEKKVVEAEERNETKHEKRAQVRAEKKARKQAYQQRKIDAEVEKEDRRISIELECVSETRLHGCGEINGCSRQKINLITDRLCSNCIMIHGRNGKKEILVDSSACPFPHQGRGIIARYRNHNVHNGHSDPESIRARPRFHGPLSITDLLTAVRLEKPLNAFVTSQIKHGLHTGCLQESRWLLLQIQTVIEEERVRLLLPPAGVSPDSPEARRHYSIMLSLLNENIHLRGLSYWLDNGRRRWIHDNETYLRGTNQKYRIFEGEWADDFIWDRLAEGDPKNTAPTPWWLTVLGSDLGTC